ncbi:MAG: adaptor protein MecA [Ruminococcus sp.]|nr:adaptor protein MecA [Ruminococcus sp.]
MTIEQLDTSKVLISLCSEDMENFQLRFNDMSFCSEHSRKVLLRLMRLACSKTGMELNTGAVLMEALPHQSGCLLLVTLMSESKRKTYKVKRFKEFPCFVFERAEEMLSCAESLGSKDISLHRNSLWLYNGRYYLMFDYPAISDVCRGLICEYAREIKSTAIILSRIRESGKLLCRDNAIEFVFSAMHR